MEHFHRLLAKSERELNINILLKKTIHYNNCDFNINHNFTKSNR